MEDSERKFRVSLKLEGMYIRNVPDPPGLRAACE